MTRLEEQNKQVNDNYEEFRKRLPDLLSSEQGRFALMRDREIVEFFDTARDAYAAGMLIYGEQLFSIQEVTDKVIDMRWYSHATT